MRLKFILAGFIIFFLADTYAQEKSDTVVEKRSHSRIRKFSPEDKPKYYIDTDIRISETEFAELLKKHLKVRIIAAYDKYGEQAVLYVDTTNTRVQQITEEMKIPEGELLPDFVMTGYNGEILDSAELKGKKVVFYFMSFFSPIGHSENWVAEFKQLERQYRTRNTVFIIVTGNDREEFMEVIGSTPVDFHIVMNGFGFMQRFAVRAFPSYLVIDESGRVLSYLNATELDKLDELL